ITRRVNVMYAGTVVETAPMRSVFKDPRHPYTLGLLASVPRLEGDRTQDLPTIPGSPPDLMNPPPGIDFGSGSLNASTGAPSRAWRMKAPNMAAG
ncbi:MAG: hypothetical protein KY395_05825, partial [Actinobacteria bacterium]|nr:hypothetical protein [Actinomycetota bacterium]